MTTKAEPLTEAEEREWRATWNDAGISLSWLPRVWATLDSLRAQLTSATERAERAEAERGRLREADALLAETQRRLDEALDTIRLHHADDDIARSYGRNTEAVRIAEDIRRRRGEDWSHIDMAALSGLETKGGET